MFKLIKSKLKKELIYMLEFEIMEIESTIYVYEEVIKYGIPTDESELVQQAYIRRIDMYTIEIPGLKIKLEGKKQLLKRLKGV